MPDIPDYVLHRAREVTGFSTVVEPEWESPHDVTRSAPGLEDGDEPELDATEAGLYWKFALQGMKGRQRQWFSELRKAVDGLARALDESGVKRRP